MKWLVERADGRLQSQQYHGHPSILFKKLPTLLPSYLSMFLLLRSWLEVIQDAT